MKNHPPHCLPMLTLALALAAGVSATATADVPFNPRQVQPGMPGNGQEQLQAYSFDQRAEFSRAVRDVAMQLDERFARLINPTDGQPDETRARAIEEAKATRTILDERISKIDQAIPENWESVRDEVLTALAQVQSAYERLAVN